VLEQTAGYQSRIHTMHSMHSKIDARNARKCASEPWTRGVNWSAYVLRAIHMEFSMYWEHPAASHSGIISSYFRISLHIRNSLNYPEHIVSTRVSTMKEQIICDCNFIIVIFILKFLRIN